MKTLCSLLVGAGLLAAGPVGYVINFSGQFGTMDLATGAFSPLGPGSASNSAGGLAGAPGGPFFTADASGHFIRFAPDGTVTGLGDTGTGPSVGPNGISVIGGLPNGTVYALDYSNRLFSINPATGTLTLLGSLTLPPPEQQYDGNMTTSFNGDGGFLYYTLDILDGPNQIAPTLFRVDPGTLAVTSVALSGLPGRIIGSGFSGGVFYGFTASGEIVRIDPLTGQATQVGTYDAGVPPDGGPPFTGVFGMVATPEPETAWMVFTGIAALGLRGRRLR